MVSLMSMRSTSEYATAGGLASVEANCALALLRAGLLVARPKSPSLMLPAASIHAHATRTLLQHADANTIQR
jgi:hypothetical protein